MSSSLAFNPRVRFPTSGWLIEARNRFTSELGLEIHVYVFKTLITLENFSLFEFIIGVLCCNLLIKQPAFFLRESRASVSLLSGFQSQVTIASNIIVVKL